MISRPMSVTSVMLKRRDKRRRTRRILLGGAEADGFIAHHDSLKSIGRKMDWAGRVALIAAKDYNGSFAAQFAVFDGLETNWR
jgi:hypothetical protein